MSLAPSLERAVKGVNRQAAAGLAAAGLMVAATGSWAALGTIQDAVMAPGTVVVNSQKKKVQHPDGGLVAEIFVEEGQHVDAGTIMFRLDGKQLSADMGTVRRRIFELRAKKWRLLSERDGLTELGIWVPPSSTGQVSEDADLAAIVTGQRRLFETKQQVLKQQELQLRERIYQLEQQVEGLNSVEVARKQQLSIARDELTKLSELAKKGLVPMTRWTPVQRDEAGLVGELGQTEAEKAKVRGQIAEVKLKLIEIKQGYRKEALDDLQAVEGELSQLVEKRVALETKLQRLDIRAPVSGRIQELALHTVGGVVGAGNTLAYIIPDNDELVIDAMIQPKEIDRVHQGATARVRFTSFDRTTTPELVGHIVWISPDQEVVSENRAPAFKVRIALNGEELKRLGGSAIGPGMEAEVMLTGTQRTVLSFLLKPMTDQLQRTFRER